MRCQMRMRAALLLVTLSATGQTPIAQQGGGAVRSPEVLSDRRVVFRLAAAKAADVRLTCECANGPQPMQKDANGVWTVTVGPLTPDIYEYEFAVDGLT